MQRAFLLMVLGLGGCLTVEKSIYTLDLWREDGQFLAVADVGGGVCPDATPLKGSTLDGVPLDIFKDNRGQHEGTGEVTGNEFGFARDTDACLGEIVLGMGDITEFVDRERLTLSLTGERESYDITFFPYALAELVITPETPLSAGSLWGSTVVFRIGALIETFGKHTSIDINYGGFLAGHTIDGLEDQIEGDALTVTFPKKDPMGGNAGPPTSLTFYGAIEYDADPPFDNGAAIGTTDFIVQLQFTPYVELMIGE